MHYLKLKNKNDNFIWPSFVDALASLLIVIIFILMIFVISQYYISQKLSGKDQVLTQLEEKILEITNHLLTVHFVMNIWIINQWSSGVE